MLAARRLNTVGTSLLLGRRWAPTPSLLAGLVVGTSVSATRAELSTATTTPTAGERDLTKPLAALPPPGSVSCNCFGRMSFSFRNKSRNMSMTSTDRACAYFSSLSSFDEPHPTLFRPSGFRGRDMAAGENDTDAQLRHDIRVMGSLLGKIIQHHEGPDIFNKVERMRHMAKAWRTASSTSTGNTSDAATSTSLTPLVDFARQLTDAELVSVSRAFTHFLAIANAAEGHHRTRRLQEQTAAAVSASAASGSAASSGGALYPKPDSCGGVLASLLQQGHSADAIVQALSHQTVELVLTAHPTEINRRTILEKKRRIQEILQKADDYRRQENTITPFAQAQLDDALFREISSIWLSDEVSRFKPTPETEAEKGTLVLETVLWEAVPRFVRKLDATCRVVLGKSLPLGAQPIRFASWMGGDRDGNPNVKPDTTRHVCLRNRSKAATLLARDLQRLMNELSINMCSDEFRSLVGSAREPYRVFLQPRLEKMKRTAVWAQEQLDLSRKDSNDDPAAVPSRRNELTVSVKDIYLSKTELYDDLMQVHRSLCSTGNEVEADGILTDILRNLSAFGLTLVPLDVRQESDRHEEAVDCITRFLGLGSYAQWDEETKIRWLTAQMSSNRPLLRPGIWRDHPEHFSPTAVDTLEIFQMIAEQHPDSLGAYVISQATNASDVLAVVLLQLDAGVKQPLRVAPLFETLSDLIGAVDTMRNLFSLNAYMGMIQGRQEVMIGYSDSAKDAGRLAASWAQYETQEALASLARQFKVNLTFFHGKGGTVGRGGNPQTFHAIMSHAPKTINGQFRVTEQGEMINQNFGYGDRAERTMDIYTAAVLAEQLTARPSPSPAWRDLMHTLSDISCQAYRNVVRGDERFVPYFRSATPELELASLNIGSRPAKRKAIGGVESLRAIPWNFAWTQTRSNLPTWLGVGEALGTTLNDPAKEPLLREMYQKWGMFRTLVDLVEMVLAKSEPAIAKHYEDMLVHDPKVKELGAKIRGIHLDTEKAILDLTSHSMLGENNLILQRALQVRNPYVDCLNILQAETLQRIRHCESGGKPENPELKNALMITITGVANGMGNTG